MSKEIDFKKMMSRAPSVGLGDLIDHAEDTDVTDSLGNVTDNVADNVSDTQRRILDILEQMPDISQLRLAEMIGIHRVNINRNIRQMPE